MTLRTLTLRHFRNIGFARLEFEGGRQFFLGGNGQGKTNLLEAVGFLTALRSFRTSESSVLRQRGEATAAIACDLDHERLGASHVLVKLHREGKEVWCDRERMARLGDYLGRFPTVVFSSQDIQFVRGSPAGRRRWLDATLAAMDVAYLRSLQDYARALAARNSLLRRGSASDAELAAFEEPLSTAGAELIRMREAGLKEISVLGREAHAKLIEGAEEAGCTYAPNFAEAEAEALKARLESGRVRDRQMRATQAGPHRDDIELRVGGMSARDFGSEGQQRSLVLSLRLAQAAWFRSKSGVLPVMLADDVLGELDPERRARFWSSLDPGSQILATGTRPPESDPGHWQVFNVKEGNFEPAEPAGEHR